MRANGDQQGKVYEAAGVVIERCLRLRQSLVIDGPPGARVWTPAAAEELFEKFTSQPDESDRSFLQKLGDQLATASPESVQLLVELVYLHLLIARDIRGAKKRQLLRNIADLGGAQLPAGELDAALDDGICKSGTGFKTYRPHMLWLLIEFARTWLGASTTENERWLSDPWAFREMVFALPGDRDQSQRQALLHLVHPGTFEPMVSATHKAQIVAALGSPSDHGRNIDETLERLRARLTPELGEGFDFYTSPLYEQWSTKAPARPKAGDEDSDVVHPGVHAWLVRAAGGERVNEWLDEGICAIYFDESFPFEIVRGETRQQLRERSAEHGVDVDKGSFSTELGQVWRFYNLLEVDDYVVTLRGADIYVGVVRALPVRERQPDETFASEATVEWLNKDHPAARSSLSAPLYSKLRTLQTFTDITEALAEIVRIGAGSPIHAEPATEGADGAPLALRCADDILAAATLLPTAWLDDVISLLEEKRQLVLYGPPGTSKTFLAQELANHLVAHTGSAELVQFHPSYTYEDFFEGYRPTSETPGALSFVLKAGPLRQIADAARQDPSSPYVLIIDEINRANLAKVFGELYFLLEYRDRPVTLQYSSEEFVLPSNLYVIGTMNTADRSIALVDAAMRRRFYFVEMSPATEPVRSLLRAWLQRAGLPPDAADLLDELNMRLNDEDAAIGPSYFMHPQIDDPVRLRRVWDHGIMPLLRDRFYGTGEERLAAFTLGAVYEAVLGHPLP